MDDSTSWIAFVKSLFIYFLLTMLFGLVGSGFIYLTTRGSDLDLILPTDHEFYTAPQFEINKRITITKKDNISIVRSRNCFWVANAK